ncbi:MAG TPA: NAD(P)-binding domain-containing protein [Tepidisphaeraceae bacterium]|nr:NAD(P)-binding domain-containing protein [Tepidisphaeraceae bacterium]
MTVTPSAPAAPLPRARPARRDNLLARYARWLHLRWPAGTVEKLPVVHRDGSTAVPGLYVVGDLTGIPLLKFSADTGAKAVRTILDDPAFRQGRGSAAGVLDLVIIGGGVSGYAAALEAKKAGLCFELLEAAEPFSTIVNFPKAKPIYTYPTGMTPAGELQFRADFKEPLVDELREQTRGVTVRVARAEKVVRHGDELEVVLADGAPVRARRVIVAIGRSGNYRKLGVPGEDRADKVFNRLHDPNDFAGQRVLVVGGGDSALEAAVACAEAGADVTLSYRKPEFSRPKPENVGRLTALVKAPTPSPRTRGEGRGEGSSPESPGRALALLPNPLPASGEREQAVPPGVCLMLGSSVQSIGDRDVTLTDANGRQVALPNDAVLTMIGREPPLDFFRHSNVPIHNERTAWWWASLAAFVLLCTWLYHWKSGHAFPFAGGLPGWLNVDPAAYVPSADRSTLLGTVLHSARSRSFYYTLVYSLVIVGFGVARIRRRGTPYVTWQTVTLMLVQVIPLFVLPEVVLPWLGANGVFESGAGGWVGRAFFPDGSYWRAYGLVLAWPLFVYNWFTAEPLWGWLVLGFLQTFVAIPAIVYFWGKGAYCGWICSCGALAETLGDRHREKMPHGPRWNKLNLLGQAVLAFAGALMLLRVLGWVWPGSAFARLFHFGFDSPLGYSWTVDLLMAGILGYGLYFWMSGRVWCRFACPLAALMHVYARLGRFRILADKKRCISCNVCTSVCHQGIDVMSFANKGQPMADPQCVRCSACIEQCPTGVLQFGQVNARTGAVIKRDPAWLAASPVLMREIGVRGKAVRL